MPAALLSTMPKYPAYKNSIIKISLLKRLIFYEAIVYIKFEPFEAGEDPDNNYQIIET